MRVQATAKGGVAATGAVRRTSTSGFTVGNDNAPSQTSAATSATALNSIDALLALQGVEDAVERRRRFAKRGVKALDMLDALKLEILEGRMDVATLSRLESMLGELTERSGERRLDDTLDAIGVRVAVELAKRQPRMAQ
jgi:class II flagellar assembly regulator FliX